MAKRPIHPIPDYVQRALHDAGLQDAYDARPPYQRNDYIGWITRAVRDDTRERRLGLMLTELASGNRYMKMAWSNPHVS